LSANVTSLAPGATAQGTVQLNGAATAATTINLTSSTPSVATVPGSVTIATGATTAGFLITAVAPGSTTITAASNGITQTMQITVSAKAALASLTLASATVVGGNVVDATVTLSAPAPAGGALVALSAEDPAAVPATVLIAEGAGATSFAITTHTVPAAKASRITATYAGASVAATLNVAPPSTAIANFGVTGSTETETCKLINAGAALDCTFNGSTSSAPATITAWDWTYGVVSTRSQTTTTPVLANPAFSCSLLPPAPLPSGATSLSMAVKLVVRDSAGNVSAEAVHNDVRVLPQGACGY
jgi:trimeric autotransporter adhesin